jgi:hypothetical protein
VRRICFAIVLLSLPVLAAAASFQDLESCLTLADGPQECLDGFVPDLLEDHTPRELLDTLTVEGKTNPLFAEKCHFVAHAIGRAAGKSSPSFSAAYRACDYRCQAGCIHGVIEQLFFHEFQKDHFSLSDLTERIPTVCSPKDIGQGRAAHIECTHGLGHALMSSFGYDLDQALAGCDLVPDSEGQLSCQLGVFMENIITDEVYLRKLKSSDPLYPCDSVDPRYRAMCYTEQPKALLGRGMATSDIASLCRTLGADADRCFEGLGRDTSLALRLNKFTEVAAVCEDNAGDHLRACVTGAVMATVDLSQDASTALPYCGAFASSSTQELCVDRTLWYLRDVHGWSEEKLDAECVLHAGTIQELCGAQRKAHDTFWARILRWLFG